MQVLDKQKDLLLHKKLVFSNQAAEVEKNIQSG